MFTPVFRSLLVGKFFGVALDTHDLNEEYQSKGGSNSTYIS